VIDLTEEEEMDAIRSLSNSIGWQVMVEGWTEDIDRLNDLGVVKDIETLFANKGQLRLLLKLVALKDDLERSEELNAEDLEDDSS